MNNILFAAKPSDVPFLDLGGQDHELHDDILLALQEVVRSGCFVLGPHVAAFEKSFAQECDVKHCVGVNSGTSALHLALIAAGVGQGDEVLTVPLTFVATSWAIRYVQARPVFVDIDPRTYTMDIEQVASRITRRTKAILPVHLYGQPAALQPLREIAERHGLALIEDAAQAHGASYQQRPAGSWGHCGCFSFYPGKNLGAYGEAGAIVTNDDALAQRLRTLRDHAQSERYHHRELGFNYRMDAFQGAVLEIKLSRLASWTAQRRRLAAQYLQRLAGLPLAVPHVAPEGQHAWHLFVVLHPQRDRLRAALQQQGIHSGLHYPIPVHLQPAFADLGYGPGDFPVSERVARECLSLPLFPNLSDSQQNAVVEALQNHCFSCI
ncbi:MAG: DegT/DnrJ/EryC1/StrS family aminotransferase [Planctomycetales bacterium]|nr:DegT/DnrJ/EryC1/StrS family aminotransferase [Planctomycetales bacterium]